MRYLRMLVATAICGMMMQGYFAALPAQVGINAQDPSDGATALMLAAKDKNGYWTVVDLLSKGANPYIKDNAGKMALEYAIDFFEQFKRPGGKIPGLLLNIWTAHVLMVFDKLLQAAPIDWAAVTAAREYAEKASGGTKAGYGTIVDYLSGKEVLIDVPELAFFVNPKDRSRDATTGEEAFLPKKFRHVTLKLPARETVTTPQIPPQQPEKPVQLPTPAALTTPPTTPSPSQDEVTALKAKNADLEKRIKELEKALKAKQPKSSAKKQPQKKKAVPAQFKDIKK